MKTQTGFLGVGEDKSSCMVVMPKRFHRSMLYSSSFSAVCQESDIDHCTHIGTATLHMIFDVVIFRFLSFVASQMLRTKDHWQVPWLSFSISRVEVC